MNTTRTKTTTQPDRCSCAMSAPIIVGGVLVCATCRRTPDLGHGAAAPMSAPYTQRALPPGAGRTKFLRVARLLRAEGDVGSWREGRTVLVSADAWPRGLALLGQGREPPPSAPVPLPAAEDDVLDALGLRRVS